MEMDGWMTGPIRPTLSSRMTLCFLLLACLVTSLSADRLSRWHLSPPWEVVFQALLPSPLLHVPLLLKGEEMEFLLAQGRFGSEDTGDAISPPLPASTASRTLSFKYAKVGAADLQILLKEGDTFRLLDSVTETTGGKWYDRTTLLPAGQGDQQLYFRARGILDGLDAVAISSIQIKSSPTSVLSVTKNIPKGIRRKPTSKQKPVREFCEPVHCDFYKNSCQWFLQGFTPLDGKVVSKETGVMTSEPILQPTNAHFQMEVFVSSNAAATVHQQTGTGEQLMWTAGGMTLPGWNTVRLPLRFSPFPSKVLVRASSPHGGYVAVRSTKLVDEFGMELACGMNVSPIKPAHDGTIRLTAVQQLKPQGPIHPQIPLSRSLLVPAMPSRLSSARTATKSPAVVHKQLQPTHFMKSIDVEKWKTLAKQSGLGEKAITPVNVSSTAKSPLLLLPPSLQKTFSEKLAQFIDLPPTTTGRETRPFQKQNMDWIVQHAFNSFMSGARP